MLQVARFFYRTESGELWPDNAGNPTEQRRLTFAYTCNKETGTVQFGATVHRDSVPKTSYQKATHRDAALGRLVVRPRIFNVAPGTRYREIEEEIRYQMTVGGSRGPRLENPRQVEVVQSPKDPGSVSYLVSDE
jgi:hypothetical protein